MPNVLLISSDANVRELVSRCLQTAGYEVTSARDEDQALRAVFTVKAQGLVLDAPAIDDIRRFRERLQAITGPLPCVFLAPSSARWVPGSLPLADERDDLVVKPFSADDVLNAVERIFAAEHGHGRDITAIGDVHLDRSVQSLRGAGTEVTLTPTEFRLLEYLTARRGVITSAEELLDKVWGFYPGTGSPELVRSHIRNLRAKLRKVSPDWDLIYTVPRRGYRLA